MAIIGPSTALSRAESGACLACYDTRVSRHPGRERRARAIDRTLGVVVAALMIGMVTVAAQAPGRWVTDKFAPLPDP